MADFRTRAVKGKGFSPRGVPVREFPSLLVAFFAIWLLACVAGVSNRVIARKLEREQKKRSQLFSTNSRGNAQLRRVSRIGYINQTVWV